MFRKTISFGGVLLFLNFSVNADCFKTAQKIEASIGSKKNDDPQAFDRALKNYLCAAKENNTAAAVRAVQLSRSGMAQRLPLEQEKALLHQAYKLGSGGAAYILAVDACPNGMSTCPNISYVTSMLKESVRRGDKDAPLLLGVIYQRGYGMSASALKALACYRLALQGDAEAARRKITGLHLPDENVPTEMACAD